MMSGLVTLKNNTVPALYRAMHVDMTERETQKFVDNTVVPFSGWALTWKPSDFPDTLFEVFEELAIAEEAWRGPVGTFSKAKIGRPRYDKAYKYFETMKFDRGSLQWKELINLIATETGERPNEATYRFWAKEYNSRRKTT